MDRINFLEHVQVKVNLIVWPRGELILTLKSPNGNVSRLTQHRPADTFRGRSENLTNWAILTLHHWGENPWGPWKLTAHLRNSFRRDRKCCLSYSHIVLRTNRTLHLSEYKIK